MKLESHAKGDNMTNWEKYIYELIDEYRLSNYDMYRAIENEITKAYCHEFIDDDTRAYLLFFLKEQLELEERNSKLYHEQRMYEIAEMQNKLMEQRKIKEILKKADDKFDKKYKKCEKSQV